MLGSQQATLFDDGFREAKKDKDAEKNNSRTSRSEKDTGDKPAAKTLKDFF
jgi:hypothetical protein